MSDYQQMPAGNEYMHTGGHFGADTRTAPTADGPSMPAQLPGADIFIGADDEFDSGTDSDTA
eukprot:12208475-Prorocentrum_lima.AAC.1